MSIFEKMKKAFYTCVPKIMIRYSWQGFPNHPPPPTLMKTSPPLSIFNFFSSFVQPPSSLPCHLQPPKCCDCATFDVVFYLKWYHGSSHVETWYLSTRMTLMCIMQQRMFTEVWHMWFFAGIIICHTHARTHARTHAHTQRHIAHSGAVHTNINIYLIYIYITKIYIYTTCYVLTAAIFITLNE